jgi:type I restriction enzyme, S subunit
MKAGWKIKTLNQISINLDSKRVPITKSERTSGVYPYYGASGIVDYIADYIFDEDTLLISEDGANLLARSTPIAFPATGKYWVNNHAHIVKFENMTTQRFVEMYLESILLDEYITGAAQPKLNQKALNSIPIPFPPLPEQQRIVAILDEAFEAIAAARANAEQNRQNARALFESYLQSVFSQRGDGWSEAKLSECFRLKSGDALTSKEMKSGEYPVYGGNGIAGTHDTFNLSGHNVIIGRVGALCGNARNIEEPIWLTDNAFQITDLKYDFNYAFLTYLLNFKNLRSLARQSAQPVISNSSLKDLLLNFPNIIEQRNIVIQLDALSNKTQHLESLYQRKIAALDELKQSLLQQAFSGQL